MILYQYHLSNAWLISRTNSQEFRVINIKKENDKPTTNASKYDKTFSVHNTTVTVSYEDFLKCFKVVIFLVF